MAIADIHPRKIDVTAEQNRVARMTSLSHCRVAFLALAGLTSWKQGGYL